MTTSALRARGLAAPRLPHRLARDGTLGATQGGTDPKREKKLAEALRDFSVRLVDPVEAETLVVAALSVVEPADERGATIVVEREDPAGNPQLGRRPAEGLREEAGHPDGREAQ